VRYTFKFSVLSKPGIIFLVEKFAKLISSKLFMEIPGKPTQQFEAIFTKASTKSSQGDKLAR
jgi:hypothetical protein